jgi:hypothetical protein
MPLVETTRGTLDESNDATTEEKARSRTKGPYCYTRTSRRTSWGMTYPFTGRT